MTALVTTAHLVLWLYAWVRSGEHRLFFILGFAMFGSWLVTGAFGGLERKVMMVGVDLAVILVIRVLCTGPRARAVAAISLGLIAFRTACMNDSYIDHSYYAAAVNCAFAAQLLVGGGFADVIGRSIDDWLGRVWPRGARALRHVAHR